MSKQAKNNPIKDFFKQENKDQNHSDKAVETEPKNQEISTLSQKLDETQSEMTRETYFQKLQKKQGNNENNQVNLFFSNLFLRYQKNQSRQQIKNIKDQQGKKKLLQTKQQELLLFILIYSSSLKQPNNSSLLVGSLSSSNFNDQLSSLNLKQKLQKKALDEDTYNLQSLQQSILSPQSKSAKPVDRKKIKELIIDRKEREQRLLQRQEKIAREMDQLQQDLRDQEKQKELDYIKRVKELHQNKHSQLEQERKTNEQMLKKCEEEIKKFQGKMPLYLKFEKQFEKKEKQYQQNHSKTPSQSIKKFSYLESKSKVFKTNESRQWTPPKNKSHYYKLLENIKPEEFFIKQNKEETRNFQKKLLKQRQYEKLNIDDEKRQKIQEFIQLDQQHPLNKIKPLQKYERTYNFREKIYDIKKEKNLPEVYERNVEDNEGQRKIGLDYLQFSKENAKSMDQNQSSSIMKDVLEEEKDIYKKKLHEQEQNQKNLGNQYMRQTLPKKQQINQIQAQIKNIQESQKLSFIEKNEKIKDKIEKLDYLLKQKEDFMKIKGNQVSSGEEQLSKYDELLINTIKAKLQISQ